VGAEHHMPVALPPGKRLGSQGRSGWVRKVPTTQEFEPQTIKPVASHYTDYVTVTSDIDLTL